MYNKINNIHLVGIGGIGMSGIADLLLRHGYHVSGSDLARNESVRSMEARGITIFLGHREENVQGAELVVYSSAVMANNIELLAAKALEIPIITRAEMLVELMRLKYAITIAGAHGKTTTTSMIALVLTGAGLDPTVIVGGRMDNFGGTNSRLGSGEFMVAEADESDGTFNKLTPSIAVVTNIDREHIDFYKTTRRIETAFLAFLNKVPFYGLSIYCGDDPRLHRISHKIQKRKASYGFQGRNTYQATHYTVENNESSYTVRVGSSTDRVRLKVPGKHNVLNSLAAIVVADELSVARKDILGNLSQFQGVQRRFQRRGEIGGVVLIDDYAHHPTEIEATLATARERFPSAKIRVVFQPHRYSRVEDLFDRFTSCFGSCDGVAVTDIYSAGENLIPGVESPHLVEAMRKKGIKHSVYVDKPLKAIENWLRLSNPGDVVLTLGAGDLPNVYKTILG